MNKNKFVKSLMIMVLLIFSTLVLTACGKSSEKYPLGSISDEVYLSAGTHQVTQKELYNEFRFDSISILQTLLDEKVFADYFAQVDYANEEHRKVLEEAINSAVFGQKDSEELVKNMKQDSSKLNRVKGFVDSLIIVGKILPNQKDALITELNETTTFIGYSDTLLDLYKQKVVVRIFAKEKLDEELKDEKSKQFIKDEDVVTYYKNNRQGKYGVEAFWTEFINLNEQRAVFRELSLKISSSGKWFLVPDIRVIDSTDARYIDLEDAANKHIKDILVNKKIKYVDEANARVEISKEDFQTYYDAYSFSEDRTGNPDIPFDAAKVLEYIVKSHNLVHAEQLAVVDGVVQVDSSSEPVTVKYEYDDITNTQLRSHIYTALKVPTAEETSNIQYSQRPNTFGEYVYLVYKFSDESATEEGVLNEDKDAFLEGNDELIAELKAEMIEKKLTDTYITEKVDEYSKENKLNIYDPILRALYSRQNDYKGATKVKDNNILAEMGTASVTVDEFYAEAEKTFGVSIANDLITNKILKEKYYDKIDKETHASNETSMKNMIVSFGQNQYAGNGYPASIGREQFLLLAFRANTVDQAIENAFVLPKVKELFEKDLEAQYDDIYEKFAQLSALQYDNYWLLRSSHILIYLDLDLNGTPDDPAKLSAEVLAEAQTLLPQFIKEMFKRIDKEVSQSKGIERLITDYNSSTRLSSDDEYEKESIWAPYKRFGFRLKQETLGEITNSSNFLTSQSRLDEVFYTRAQAIYEIVKDYQVSQFPYLDFYNDDVSYDPENPESTIGNIDKIQTAFGWHLIMANGVDNKMPSAKLEVQTDDSHLSKIEVDGVRLDGTNENDVVNAKQIEIFLKESASEYNVQIRVSSAIQRQFGPVKAKYESTQMKSEIMYRLLVTNGLTYADAADNEKFEAIREINKLQLFDYQVGSSTAFDALWGTWFDVFK